MCWLTKLSPAGSVCAWELMSSWAAELLATRPGEVFVDIGCWDRRERWLCLGLAHGSVLGTFWKREATKKEFERKLQGAKRKNSFIVITRE